MEKGFKYQATVISKLKSSTIKMAWQTENNSKDCGIFLMRHMETYKGHAMNWNTGFKIEGVSNFIFLIITYNSLFI